MYTLTLPCLCCWIQHKTHLSCHTIFLSSPIACWYMRIFTRSQHPHQGCWKYIRRATGKHSWQLSCMLFIISGAGSAAIELGCLAAAWTWLPCCQLLLEPSLSSPAGSGSAITTCLGIFALCTFLLLMYGTASATCLCMKSNLLNCNTSCEGFLLMNPSSSTSWYCPVDRSIRIRHFLVARIGPSSSEMIPSSSLLSDAMLSSRQNSWQQHSNIETHIHSHTHTHTHTHTQTLTLLPKQTPTTQYIRRATRKQSWQQSCVCIKIACACAWWGHVEDQGWKCVFKCLERMLILTRTCIRMLGMKIKY